MGFFKNIILGLKKTKEALSQKLEQIFKGGEINEEFFEELEYVLITSDISSATTAQVIKELKRKIKDNKLKTMEQVKSLLREILIEVLQEVAPIKFDYPEALLIVGVNGVGKTTTIGKMAAYFKSQKKEVLLVAGDTFRAAASEQLAQWATRVKTRIVKHTQGADPSAVVYDAVSSAKAKKTDMLLIDTAGRLHNKVGLMEELKKISRTVEKNYPEANYKKLLVIDATTGQNALSQVKYFDEAVGLDGIVLTKLDGTAKGGIAITIVSEFNLPIAFVGVGEKLEDLRPFDSKEFINAII